MRNLEGKSVLITGGASGIGKIMARLLLERKAKIVIWDIDDKKMQETISAFSAKGIITGYKVDISNAEDIIPPVPPPIIKI